MNHEDGRPMTPDEIAKLPHWEPLPLATECPPCDIRKELFNRIVTGFGIPAGLLGAS